MIGLIDSHSHLFGEEFDDDLSEVIVRAQQSGVTHIFMPNIDETTVQSLLDVCSTYAGYCFPMIGLHPTSVDADYKKRLQAVHQWLLQKNNFVAVGEIGMDLYWDQTYLKEQQWVFDQQVQWALEYHLPIVIHSREAFDYIYKVLEPYKNSGLTGIFHSFTGNQEEAMRMMEFEGFKIGINGVLTFKKSTLPEVLHEVPLERLVLETDSPYLAPVPCRGKRNESSFIRYTSMKLAEVYEKSLEEVAEVTSNNALKVFGMLK